MIPVFPAFKPLEISDATEIRKFTKRFPPFSDFNFVSLASYDLNVETAVSWLRGNLVLRLLDYLTGEPVYTFLGDSRATETIGDLFRFQKDRGMSPRLKYVPESLVSAERSRIQETYTVSEDEDSADYVFSADLISSYAFEGLTRKRKRVAQFRRAHPHHRVVDLDLRSPDTVSDIEGLCYEWRILKGRSEREVEREFQAISAGLSLIDESDLTGLGVVVDDRLVGFNIHEVLGDGYGMVHFGKAHPGLKGLGEFLELATATVMKQQHCELMNYQQDLGLEGLRKYKQSLLPVAMLQKLTIEEKRGNSPDSPR